MKRVVMCLGLLASVGLGSLLISSQAFAESPLERRVKAVEVTAAGLSLKLKAIEDRVKSLGSAPTVSWTCSVPCCRKDDRGRLVEYAAMETTTGDSLSEAISAAARECDRRWTDGICGDFSPAKMCVKN